jgi:hypothetical protein
MTQNDDIIVRLRRWADNAKEQGVGEVVEGLQSAADEIERLRAERDEARRDACNSHALVMDESDFERVALRYAKENGWDCFQNGWCCKENTND